METKETLRAMPVYLTDAVRKRLRLAAAQHDTTMTAIASEAIEKALDTLEKKNLDTGYPGALDWAKEQEGE